mgnify:FL=1
MKKFAVGSFVFAAVSSLSILGQTGAPGAVVCLVGKQDCEKEVRRVPVAGFVRDESGAVFYTIEANESWRRTEIEVRRGQRIEVSAYGTVRWAQDGIEKAAISRRLELLSFSVP